MVEVLNHTYASNGFGSSHYVFKVTCTLIHLYYRAIYTAKRERLKTYVSGTDDQKNATLLSKIVQNKLTKAATNFIKKPDSSFTTSSLRQSPNPS